MCLSRLIYPVSGKRSRPADSPAKGGDRGGNGEKARAGRKCVKIGEEMGEKAMESARRKRQRGLAREK